MTTGTLPRRRSLTQELKDNAALLFGFAGVFWLVELTNLLLFHGQLERYGIRPRDVRALWGILWAPFLHHGLAHLVANTVPFLVLGALALLRSRREFLFVTAASILVGGLGTWLFGRPDTVHIGASGLIFGYLGYLLFRGFWERSVSAIAVAVVAGLLYGGALWGVLPGQHGISWEGHLFGLAGGGGAARVTARRRQPALGDRAARRLVA